ncbi:MAG TPA: YdeI/OmpD-associated family protein [Patescibacteria group bacterium]
MALQRPRYPLPDDIQQRLTDQGLMDKYRERPEYQQNDYIGWITRAKQDSTREKRLNQMIEELRGGTEYMKMKWHPKHK